MTLNNYLDRKTALIFKDRTSGGLVLTGKAAVLKTAGFCPWGFESLILRQFYRSETNKNNSQER